MVCYLETAHGIEPLVASDHCRLVAVDKPQGARVAKGDTVCWMEHADLVETAVSAAKTAVKKVKKAVKEAVAQADSEVLPPTKSKWKDGMVAKR